jgi:FkbM family methyltransferase
MKDLIKNILRKNGYQIKRYPDCNYDMERRMKIIDNFNIDTLFDIGANAGQYASRIREYGYSKRIISFEPLKSVYQKLEIASQNDNYWSVNNYAIGNVDTRSVINIAGNLDSSSILNMLPKHIESAPESSYIGREEIEIKKIDTIFNSFCSIHDSVMIKIDTQGYEKNVIDGALDSLTRIKVLQLEMSLVPLYENETLFVEMIGYLDKKGFVLYSLENGFSNPNTGQLLQVDGIFINKTFADK